jgi:hypothetical protein
MYATAGKFDAAGSLKLKWKQLAVGRIHYFIVSCNLAWAQVLAPAPTFLALATTSTMEGADAKSQNQHLEPLFGIHCGCPQG